MTATTRDRVRAPSVRGFFYGRTKGASCDPIALEILYHAPLNKPEHRKQLRVRTGGRFALLGEFEWFGPAPVPCWMNKPSPPQGPPL